MNTSSSKRAVIGVASPLDNAGILLHMLSILGPGHHLFISAVSKTWRESYKRVDSVQAAELTWQSYKRVDSVQAAELTWHYHEVAAMHTITSQTTLCSAARIVGEVADVATLRVAQGLGLQISDEVLIGAAEAQAASVPKLQWLRTEDNCPLSAEFAYHAAQSGSVDTLKWLKDHGCAFTTHTCEGAAAGGHQHVLQFLRDE
eukprot:4174-Heterococcus_DN1.PRE.1